MDVQQPDEPAGSPPDATVVEALVAERERFLAFLLPRVGDRDLAEDLLQTAFVHAIRGARDLREEERVVPWIYRILRNVLADHGRRRSASVRALERVTKTELPAAAPPDIESEICACVSRLLDTLPTDQAALLRMVELEDVKPSDAARRLGVSAGAARVRLHRARSALRERVEQACRTCSRHGCLDCTCRASPARGRFAP